MTGINEVVERRFFTLHISNWIQRFPEDRIDFVLSKHSVLSIDGHLANISDYIQKRYGSFFIFVSSRYE